MFDRKIMKIKDLPTINLQNEALSILGYVRNEYALNTDICDWRMHDIDHVKYVAGFDCRFWRRVLAERFCEAKMMRPEMWPEAPPREAP